MALDIIPKQEGGKLKAVASGTLPSGQPVVVNSDGTVSVVGESNVSEAVGTPTTFQSGNTEATSVAYDANAQKVVVAYLDEPSQLGKAVVGTVSGNAISFGTPVTFQASNVNWNSVVYDANTQKIVIVYEDGVAEVGKAIVGTVSGTSISFGSAATFDANAATYFSATYDANAQKIVIFYADGSNYGKSIVGTVSGTSISFGSITVYNSASSTWTSSTFDSLNNKVVVAFRGATSGYGEAMVGTVSGTSISFGSSTVFSTQTSGGTSEISAVFDSSANKVVIGWQDGTDSNKGAAVVGTVSGTSISFGSKVFFSDSASGDISGTFDSNANKVVFFYRDNSNSNQGTLNSGTVSGSSITFGTETIFETGGTYKVSSTFDANAQKVVVVYRDNNDSLNGKAAVFQPSYTSTNLTSENYIGMSGGAVTGFVSAVGTPAVSSAVQSSYFGSTFDSNSNKVVVTYYDQTNGKGMAVVGTVSGTSISFGTPVEYSSQAALTYSQAVVFDSNSNKVVIAYVDSGGSSYGTAIVGTVSGTSISFGTAVVFESASTAYPQATFDNVNNKVIIAYEDGGDSDKGKAVVGTVSGTSISFGSTATFNAGGTSYPAVAYDTNAQKVVVAYRDKSASDHGKAVVGTVSGTSISFGSATTFNAANTNYNIVVYDEAAQKVVVYYQGADTNMEAIVGTVSGTSISFGTAAEFSASNSTNMSATYDANAAKTVVFYRDASNSSYGTYNVGTVDGTSISFSDPVVFEEADSRFTTGTYDSNSQKVVVSYEDVGNSQYATSTVINVGYINRGEVSDGDTATVDIVGTVSSNQVGLTAGQQYYVQTDGTIGTTPADPSVLAGTAVSATKLLVKT